MPFYSCIFRRALFVVIAAFLVVSCVSNSDKTEKKNGYIFTYFTKNGEDGLHLAASTDGYNWQKIERPADFWLPAIGNSKLMRDPSVVKGPDGTYHMVWTSGWNENNIGYASTKDFIKWSEQQEIPVMAHEPTVRNSWAPEVVYDEKTGNFVIFWSSTIPGRFPETDGASEEGYNHRLYYTTTKDFKTFTPTALFYDPGFSVIDATFLTFNDQLYLIVKDETRFPPKKYFQIAVAHSKTGPFEKLSDPITPEGFWVEGPTAVQVGDAAIIYYDAYMTRRYGALRSTDMKTWEDISDQMHFPDENSPIRMRHGTVIEVPLNVLGRLGIMHKF